jgi:hypothetical protein
MNRFFADYSAVSWQGRMSENHLTFAEKFRHSVPYFESRLIHLDGPNPAESWDIDELRAPGQVLSENLL